MLKPSNLISTEQFFQEALQELNIDNSRQKILQSIAASISSRIVDNKLVNLNFICTHNSRRSQLAQIWSSFASQYFGLERIESFSGGTAVTAFFKNTVATLQEVGFDFELMEFSHQNPVYNIRYEDNVHPIRGYSKLYDDSHNNRPFIAITTCSSAEENCPFIPDAIHRFHLPFNDPKEFDNTEYEQKKYLETNKEIAGEIHFIYKTVSNSN